MAERMRFGVFLPPYHAPKENPSLALHRNLWLAETLDRFGYDELWVGEHHSGGYETIGPPEMFIASAADARGISASVRASHRSAITVR